MTDRVVVDRIDFREALVFPRVVGSVVGALRPGRMLLGAFVLLCLVMVGRVHDALRGPTVQPAGLLAPPRTAFEATAGSEVARQAARDFLPRELQPDGLDDFRRPVDVDAVHAALVLARVSAQADDAPRLDRAIDRLQPFRKRHAFEALGSAVAMRFDAMVAGVVTLDGRQVASSLGDLLVTVPLALWREDWIFAVGFAIVGGLGFGLLGAALARMAALDLAGRPGISPADAVAFAWQRAGNHALVPLWPGIALLVLLPVALILGWMGRVPGLDLVAGLLYPLALFFATLASIVLLPWLLVMPMAVAAAACEGCDGLEAAQRCGALVFRRPLHTVLYAACAVLGVCLVAFVADLVVTSSINLAASLAGITAGDGALASAGGARLLAPTLDAAPPVSDGSAVGTLRVSAVGLVWFWQGVLQVLAAGAVLSAIVTAATAAYLALRRTCDDQPFEDLWMPGTPAGTRADA